VRIALDIAALNEPRSQALWREDLDYSWTRLEQEDFDSLGSSVWNEECRSFLQQAHLRLYEVTGISVMQRLILTFGPRQWWSLMMEPSTMHIFCLCWWLLVHSTSWCCDSSIPKIWTSVSKWKPELSWPSVLVLLFRMLCFTFLNTTFFIAWLSKKEAITETIVFDAGLLLAMKTGVEALRGLYYKICMDGWMFGWTAKDPAADHAMKIFEVDWIGIAL